MIGVLWSFYMVNNSVYVFFFHAFTRFQNNLLLICVCFYSKPIESACVRIKIWLEKKIHAINIISIRFSCAFFTSRVLSMRSAITSIIYILNTKHTTATNEKIPSKKLQLSDFNAGFWFLSWNSFSTLKEKKQDDSNKYTTTATTLSSAKFLSTWTTKTMENQL